MSLTDAQVRTLLETALGRPRQVQSAEGMVTQYSADDLIKLANYVAGLNSEGAQEFKGLGFVRLKPPDARNRISTSTD